MDYILVMSMSGGCMVILYLLLIQFAKERYPIKLRYFILKITILYYLIPLPFLKKFYQDVWYFWRTKLLEKNPENVLVWFEQEQKRIVQNGKSLYINQALEESIWTGGIWFVIALLIMVYNIRVYRRNKSKISACNRKFSTTEEEILLRKIKNSFHIRRNVILRTTDADNIAMTIGIFKPLIVCSQTEDRLEQELMLKHELMHIKEKDMLWLVATSLVLSIHWFNPFAWILNKEIRWVCELNCDEEVLKQLNREEMFCYAELLIKYSTYNKKAIRGLTLAQGTKLIEERVLRIMERNMRKWNMKFSIIVCLTIIFLNSLTVYAYEDMAEVTISEQISVREEIEERIEGEFVFVPSGEESPYQNSFVEIKYDYQFVDDQGNIYPAEEQVSVQALCQHNYVTGTVNKHEVYSNGSCKIIFYEAQRCTKCGSIIIGAKTGEQTNNPCSH